MKTIKIFTTNTMRSVLTYYNIQLIYKDYQIIYDNKNIYDCDILVVFAECGWNNYKFNTLAQRRICFTGEPTAIYQYSSDFFNQFTDIVTCQSNVHVNNNVKIHPYSQGE